MNLIDCHTHLGAEMSAYLRGDFPYGQQFEDLVREGALGGVTHWITFPMVTNLSLNLMALQKEKVDTEGAFERVPYQFENRRMMGEVYDLFPVQAQSALPFPMFDPGRETAGQAKALRALKQDYRIYGLKTQPTMIESRITALNEHGSVFLDLAREWDLPLLIHSSVLPSDVWSQASDIIDIAERNPDVRFIAAHSCRFDKESLDRIAALPNCWFDCSAHGIHCILAVQNHPSVATPERRFESDYTRPDVVLRDLTEAYEDKLIWGSDAPYYSFAARIEGCKVALMSSYALEIQYFKALPERLQQKAGWDNTRAWLGPKNAPA